MDPQNPRIEPDLTAPAAAPQLTASKATPPSEKMTKKRTSLFGLLLKLSLILIALVLLPIVLFKWVPLPTTAFMLQSEVKPVEYTWVPAKNIAKFAGQAVISAEDQKFYTHNGFDIEAMEKAYAHNKKSKRKRGASTISQQTAKNLFLWSGGGYFRKGIEAGVTVLIENIWGKQRILEVYLNVAEFGPGLYGVEAASQKYFHKSAAQLTPTEAARLAAVLPNPKRWKVNSPGAYVQKRVRWIVGQMGYGSRGTPSEEPEPPSTGPESGGQLNDIDAPLSTEAPIVTTEPEAPIEAEPSGAPMPVPVPVAPEAGTAPAPEAATP
nr:monofunctional biosynthetic peptidoglycan transglycosylase [Stenotrophobium rhamnosiphilum]